MANRVTDTEVFEIIDTVLIDIDVFITTANAMVTAWLGASSLSDATLKEIEKYLSAHVLSLRDPRTKSESIAGALAETYQGQWGKGLDGTSYGQTAILLDTTGVLGRIAKNGYSIPASMDTIGYHKYEY